MSWIKQVFTDFQTVITAAFLNDLQDQIIADETAVSGMVSGVKGNSENAYRHGNVNLTKANIGLGNVDNTSDAQKPVSNATQDALDSKVDKVTGKGLSTNDYTTAEKQRVAASALQADLDAVDDRVDATGVEEWYNADLWLEGHLNSGSGIISTTQTYNRMSTPNLIPANVAHIKVQEGYKIIPYCWSADGSTYLGLWDGTAPTKTWTENAWMVGTVDLKAISTEYRFKIIAQLAIGSRQLTPEADADKFIFTSFSDETLSISGKAADAKKTGGILSAIIVYDTTNGDIAKFSNGADNVPIKSLIANINSEQDGTGDPSISNVRLITGKTGLTGKRAGGNILSMTDVYGSSPESTTTKDAQTGTIVVINTNSQRYTGVFLWYAGLLILNPFPRGIYTVSFDIAGTITTTWVAGTRAKSTGVFDSTERVGFSSPGHYSFTLDSSMWTYDKYISIVRTGDETSDINITISNFTIVPGSVEGTIEPYVSQDISVSWQDTAGTVHGGTLDIASGKMMVTHEICEFDGVTDGKMLDFTSGITTANIYGISSVANSDSGGATSVYISAEAATNLGMMCSIGKYTRDTSFPDGLGYIAYANTDGSLSLRIGFPLTMGIDTIAKANEYLHNLYQAGTPCQIRYKLLTPIPYQLTPQEITTLLGNNTVWTNVGPVSITAPRDTKMYIDGKIAEAIAAALNA